MPKFAWEGTTRQGETKKGVMEGANEEAVVARLRGEQISAKTVKKAREFKLKLGTGVKEKDILVFTRMLATMIDAWVHGTGIPVDAVPPFCAAMMVLPP